MIILPVILSVLLGIATGYPLRQKHFVKYADHLLNGVIMLLLFFLGIAVGSNQQVVTRFATIGLEALLLTLGGTMGSLLAARWIYKRLFHQSDDSSLLQKGKKQVKR